MEKDELIESLNQKSSVDVNQDLKDFTSEDPEKLICTRIPDKEGGKRNKTKKSKTNKSKKSKKSKKTKSKKSIKRRTYKNSKK